MSSAPPDAAQVRARLDVLAASPLLAHHRTQLQRLGADLDRPDAVALWAEVDLAGAFTVDDDHLSAPPESGTIRFAEAARAVLIFVPLLVTWAGISLATRAYAKVADLPEFKGQPFIALWEKGFGGQGGPVLSLSVVAMLDVAAIVALIICTLYVQMERGRVERAAYEVVRSVRRELSSTLLDASMIAARERFSSPERFQNLLNDAAGEFATLVERLGGAVEQADRVSEQVLAAAESVTAVVAALDAATPNVASVAGDLRAAAAALPGPIQDLGTAMADLDRSIGTHAAALGSTSSGLSDALQALEAASTTARDQLELAGPALAEAMARESELTDRVAATLADQQQVAAGVGAAAAQVAALHQASISSAASAAQATHEALGAAQQFAAQVAQSVASVQGLGVAQHEFAELLRTTNASVEVGVNRLRADLEQLHAVLQWLSDLGGDGAGPA